MEQRTRVFICCSPHKRTGATTTARLLSDYFILSGRSFAGFDTDLREPEYGACFPDDVTNVDCSKIRGQVEMFDRLLVADATPKVVDLRHREYAGFLDTIGEIGFMDEARRAAVQPIVLFHADASEAALAASQALAARWPELDLVIVTNKGAAPLGLAATDVLGQYPSSRRFIIGALDSAAWACFQAPEFSFSRFLPAPPPDISIVIGTALRAWVAPIFAQFRTFELQLSIEGARFM